MTPYLIDGKEARGEDYVGRIDTLPSDDLAYFRVRIPDKGTLMVSTHPGGVVVTDERLDGSSWTSRVLRENGSMRCSDGTTLPPRPPRAYPNSERDLLWSNDPRIWKPLR